jgi:hypothetical protein
MNPADELRLVIALNQNVKPVEAEQRFERVIEQCSEADLRALSASLDAALASFHKKRRRRLAELLAKRLTRPQSYVAGAFFFPGAS